MSKIESFEIKDFMSISYAKFVFDDTNIINLVGYNDSGKSAVTRALEVILYDAYTQLHVKFIRDDMEHFAIGLEFDDGVEINRYKFRNGKSIWEMMKNGEILYTNELETGIAAVGGVPKIISDYLGVVEEQETGSRLNTRRNTDKLFLVETSGGENYKIINKVLRCDVLADAAKELNADRNKMQTEYINTKNRRDTLRVEFESIELVPDYVLDDLDVALDTLSNKNIQMQYLSSMGEKQDMLSQLHIYDELVPVDTSRLAELERLAYLMQSANVATYDELESVSTERLNHLLSMAVLVDNMNISTYDEVKPVAMSQYDDLMNLGKTYTDLYNASVTAANIEAEHKQVLGQLEELSKQHGFKICDGCGSVVA